MPVISLPTRIQYNSESVIDNIYTNSINPDIVSGNISVGISDHLPSFMIIPKSKCQHLPKKHNLYKRNTKNINYNSFTNELNAVDWDTVLDLNSNNVNNSFDNFYNCVNNSLDKHAPIRKLTRKEFKQKFKPWITTGIIVSIKRKHSLFNKYIKCKDSTRKITLHNEYKALRNRITNIILDSKKYYYTKFFIDNNNNLRKVWQGIKEIINIKSKNTSAPNCIIQGSNSVTDPKSVAEKFNSYFSTIASTILNERKYEGSKSFQDYMPDPLPNSFAFDPTDEVEISSLLGNLNKNKSYGPFSFPAEVLHKIKDSISKPLSKIINLSFNSGVHPDNLKISKTIPVYKKGSRLTVSNYRPISLLSNLNKVFEKLIFNRVYGFLENHGCIYEHQYGFRKKHSTNHALISITDKIREALDKNLVAVGVFIDFQKAFDTVNHQILINKLSNYGIRGCINDWFKSYLTNRRQFVSIDGFKSAEESIEHGVPQGSVLGPLLFLLYINDLHLAIINSSTFHFADDTHLLKIAKSVKKIQKQINIDLKLLVSWLLANKISLNKTKTELIIFRKPRDKINHNIKIKLHGHKLRPTSSLKYLGIILDETLNGKIHLSQLIPKLTRANNMLSKVRHFVPEDKLISIYFAIFSSHMTYGCQIWGQNENNPLFKKIERLQKRALRIISFSRFEDHCDPLFKKYKILKLKDYITLQNCLLIHDHTRNLLPDSFKDYFLPCNDLYNTDTRACAGSIFVPHVSSKTYGRKSIKLTSILEWNHLTQVLNQNLLKLTRYNLKKTLTNYFLNSYS